MKKNRCDMRRVTVIDCKYSLSVTEHNSKARATSAEKSPQTMNSMCGEILDISIALRHKRPTCWFSLIQNVRQFGFRFRLLLSSACGAMA